MPKSEWAAASSKNDGDVCSASDAVAADVERALFPYHYRGGYKDDVAVMEKVTGSSETDESTTGKHRLDEAAKAKVYDKLEFSLFQKGDGSDQDPDGIPWIGEKNTTLITS